MNMAKRSYDQLSSEEDHRALLESQIRALSDLSHSLTDANIREIVDSVYPVIESIPRITTDEEAACAVVAVFDAETESYATYSEALWRWAQKNPEERIPAIERMVAAHIEHGGIMTLSIFSLLGRLDKDRPHLLVEDECARALAVANVVPQTFFDQLAVMDRFPDGGTRAVTHHIFDFVRTYIRSMQNDGERNLGSSRNSLGVFAEQFFDFLNSELPHINNYLLVKQGTDILEMKSFLNPHKESALPGVAGGSEDETIYTHAHAAESYANRNMLGFYERSLLARPALPCAPGLIAVYKNGRIDRVYRRADTQNTQTPDSVWIQKANPVGAHDDVYAERSIRENAAG